jgi:hypothetical protein
MTMIAAPGAEGHAALGDPLDKNTDAGAINSGEQLSRIRELADAGDAEARSGGHRRGAPPAAWFPPTLFTHASQSSRTPRERSSARSCPSHLLPRPKLEKANNTVYGSAGI